jgi:hypothetical protein
MALHKLAPRTYFDLNKGLIASSPRNSNTAHSMGFDEDARFHMMVVGQTYGICVEGPPGNDFGFDLDEDAKKICQQQWCGIDTDDEAGPLKTTSIGLKCIQPGTGKLFMVHLGDDKRVAHIDLQAVAVRNVRTRYYNLSDRAGRKAIPERSFEKTAAVSDAGLMNRAARLCLIVGFQAGINMRNQGGLRELSASADLGNAVDIDTIHRHVLGGDGWDPGAEYHVILVWAIKDSNPTTRAITKGNITLVEIRILGDERGLELTMAHEFVHYVCGDGIIQSGHDELKSDFMFPTSPHGIMMREKRLKKATFVR